MIPIPRSPRWSPVVWNRLVRDRLGETREVVHVALRVLVAHDDRRGPALPLGTRALEHASVELPEPTQLGHAVVDRPQVPVGVDRLGPPIDRTLRRQGLHGCGQPVGRDDVLAAVQDRVDLVEAHVRVLREHLGEVDLGGRHRQRVAVEGAHLLEVAIDHHAQRVLGAADRATREARTQRLRVGDQVGLHAEDLDRATPAPP